MFDEFSRSAEAVSDRGRKWLLILGAKLGSWLWMDPQVDHVCERGGGRGSKIDGGSKYWSRRSWFTVYIYI